MAIDRIFKALLYAAQKGRLQRVQTFLPMIKKTDYSTSELSEMLSAFCKQSISPLALNPETLEGLNAAAIAFRESRLGQARGIDSNLLTLG